MKAARGLDSSGGFRGGGSRGDRKSGGSADFSVCTVLGEIGDDLLKLQENASQVHGANSDVVSSNRDTTSSLRT